MKFYIKPVLSILALGALLTIAACKGGTDPQPSEEEAQLKKLTTTWTVAGNGNVKLDGVSKKTDYATFELTLTGTAGASSYGYTTANRPALSPWKSSGTWNFGSAISTDVIRDKGTASELDVTYSVSDTQLELTFTYNGAGESRTSDVTGVWVFTLVKK